MSLKMSILILKVCIEEKNQQQQIQERVPFLADNNEQN